MSFCEIKRKRRLPSAEVVQGHEDHILLRYKSRALWKRETEA